MPEEKYEKSARAQEIEALIVSAATPNEASAAMNWALDALLQESEPLTAAEARTIRTLVNQKIKELLVEERSKKPR